MHRASHDEPRPESTEASDDVVAARAAQGDREAFVALYERHVPAVFRYSLSRLGDRQAAEDVTSEVFLKALNRIGEFRGGTFAAWLIVIARNTVIDRQRGLRPTVDIDDVPEPVDGAPGPEDEAVAAVEHERLRAAFAELSDDQRAVLDLQLAGWRGPEIAEALGKSDAAVKMLRLRAMQRLRPLLTADDGEASAEATDAR